MRTHPARRYLVSFGAALLIAVGVCALRGVFAGLETSQLLSALCDAAFVPGALLLGLGVLIFVADDGFFDIMSYGLLRATHIIDWVRARKDEGPRDFFEYKQMKHAGKKASYTPLLLTGAFFLLLSLFILLLYETY